MLLSSVAFMTVMVPPTVINSSSMSRNETELGAEVGIARSTNSTATPVSISPSRLAVYTRMWVAPAGNGVSELNPYSARGAPTATAATRAGSPPTSSRWAGPAPQYSTYWSTAASSSARVTLTTPPTCPPSTSVSVKDRPPASLVGMARSTTATPTPSRISPSLFTLWTTRRLALAGKGVPLGIRWATRAPVLSTRPTAEPKRCPSADSQ
mmetsp:Transcript_19746/g.50077  ORF Transcript_19746/g.50077 Transcript_19746/m.50077 type:complete len:210 (-) Transcript_19746:4117-4746(-)